MSRLLHAAARGARIEDNGEGVWSESRFVHLVGGDWEFRIHPDDQYLQYGPISAELREMAADDSWTSKCWKWSIANSAANEFTVYFDSRTGEPDYPLFYLFLAEFLADEGM
jgi:hypothetical protein